MKGEAGKVSPFCFYSMYSIKSKIKPSENPIFKASLVIVLIIKGNELFLKILVPVVFCITATYYINK